ncbi:hypothetical protein VDGD_02618 [Verticillium dahliae]|uniref:Uncharacterized protein n=1 Tax=Verticillium dahliae TaxID=27337 RepID=A0A366Q6C9_VERDA|nr:hypothetical protein VDGD_02618 [Verticillium dahliae]RXG44156.1 hypothetical protein VDGE_02618 [Verticillium dahliae]
MHTTLSLSVGLSILAAFTTAAPAAGHGHRVRSNAGFIAMRQATNGTAPPANNNNNNNNNNGGGAGSNKTPSDTQLMNAVMGWMNDTGKVTNFVNTATSLTGDEFTLQAQIALNAELDELNHKKILDAGLGDNPMVQSANEVLETQGTFQNVVDVLQAMVNNGPDTAQADVNAINNNRCVNVLPNIDMYFAAAGMPEVSAARPTGCLEVAGAPTGALPPAGGADASAPASSPSPTPAPGAGGGNAGNATSKNNGNGAGNKSGTKSGTNKAARGGQAGGAAT